MNSIKLQDTKINVQKFLAFLYTTDEAAECEIKKIPFTVAQKNVKYLAINLTKEVKNLYTKTIESL